MELHSPNYIDLTGKIILLKTNPYMGDLTLSFRLRRVTEQGSPINTYVRVARIVPKVGASQTEIWNRDHVEGWLTDINAEQLLMWEALSK